MNLKLNLGCGNDIRQGYMNYDKFNPEARYIDLNNIPYNFNDNSAKIILFLDVLEHLSIHKMTVIKELYRILQPGGYLYIRLPLFCPTIEHDENTFSRYYFNAILINPIRFIKFRNKNYHLKSSEIQNKLFKCIYFHEKKISRFIPFTACRLLDCNLYWELEAIKHI